MKDLLDMVGKEQCRGKLNSVRLALIDAIFSHQTAWLKYSQPHARGVLESSAVHSLTDAYQPRVLLTTAHPGANELNRLAEIIYIIAVEETYPCQYAH